MSSFFRNGSQGVSNSLPSIFLHQLGSIICLQPITSSESEIKVIVDHILIPPKVLPSNTPSNKVSISEKDRGNKQNQDKLKTKAT